MTRGMDAVGWAGKGGEQMAQREKVAIVVHGGAGALRSEERGRKAEEGCLRAARRGYEVLARGGSALDAVEAACVALEDDPLFNAGTGSSLNADGQVEMDAAIMEGSNLRVGGVASIRGVKNPIQVARRVMEDSPHVLLVAEGAERFAREQGFPPYPPSRLVTEAALARWEKERREAIPPRLGTVGAVAIDARGCVASATSTGGTSGKAAGRVGDSPIPGAGLYAAKGSGAVSATGEGEAILRLVLSKHVCDRMGAGLSAQEAIAVGLEGLKLVGGEAGLIAVDRLGRLGVGTNAPFMSYAAIDDTGERSGYRGGREDS